MDAIAVKATELLRHSGTSEMSMLAWAFGKARHRAPDFFRAYAREVTRCHVSWRAVSTCSAVV